MGKFVTFMLAVVFVMGLAFLYLNYRAGVPLFGWFDDARRAQRCGAFEQRVAGDKELTSLGYGGRLQQLLHGCF